MVNYLIALSPQEQRFFCAFTNHTNIKTIVHSWTCANAARACSIVKLKSLIICNAQKNFIMVRIYESELRGIIPTEIGYLSQLESLDLSHTNIQGTIPSEIGNLRNLRSLLLDDVPLTGNLPSTITQLTLLNGLFLPASLTATLPDNIGQLKSLRTLICFQNYYGTIPSSIGQLRNVTLLYFWNTGFIGTIPDTITQLTQLQELTIGNNSLTGTIPQGFSGFSNLLSLIIDEKKLYGYVDISRATELRDLELVLGTPTPLIGCPQNLRRCKLVNVITQRNCTLPPICSQQKN